MSKTIQSSQTKQALLQKYLRYNRSLSTTTNGNAIPRQPRDGSLPLSIGQQSLYFLSQVTPDVPVYNECVTLRLYGSLNIPLFEQSFNEILRRHEMWRTSFPIENGQPVQHIHAYQPITMPVIDLTHLPEAERESEALHLASENAEQPFDFAHGPLLRPLLIRLNERDTRLFLTLHHLIFDGFSLYQILLPELREIYEALLDGRSPSLADLPIQYADFAAWQQEAVRKENFSSHMMYWKEQLADIPTVLALPTDHPRPQTPTFRGAMYPFALSKNLLDDLKNLSLQENVTLFITMVAALQTLLHRYCEQEDILLGTAISDRRQPEVQKLLGFFLNTVVLRINLSDNPSFRDLLQQVRMVFLDAQAHQDVPFEYLVKELQPERTPGQNPLFQVMVAIEPPLPILPSGWTLTQMDVQTDASKFDLHLELDERPEGILGRFKYSSDLFDRTTIARMFEHWQTLLESIVADPGQRLSELSLLTENEKQIMLTQWNDTTTEYPALCVHQLFEARAKQTPNAVALVVKEQQMTYQELNTKANQLAHHLHHLGVKTEVPVGLCMERSFEMVISCLGILKAGGAYVPLDPLYPKERLAFMLKDTQAPVLITQKRFVPLLPDEGIQVVCLDTDWLTIAQECPENPENETTTQNLAYVMYTSGSTGTPKGVEVRHLSIIRLLFGVNYVQLDATKTMLHMASISFDAATFELWGALLHGARCILFPEPLPTPRSISAVVRKYKVTTLWLTASLFNMLIDEAPDALGSVEQLLTGGEALSVPHIRRALKLFSSTQIINGYGPTEGTTFTCCYPIPSQLSENVHSIPIGYPIGNTRVYILDRTLNLVPVGVAGELYIGGDGLARGYINRPELTAEKFIISPFSSTPGERLYKTGDRVRYLPDGSIEFLGRDDQQVKIRGFRIEPGEIEMALSQSSFVQEAVVLTREDEHAQKYLVAYIVPQQGQEITHNELSRFLKERLPDYMIPSRFVQLDSLPLTSNGKLNRAALALPDETQLAQEETLIAPVSTAQYRLVQIWEELLHVQPIGIRDNFFYLGGHSLLAGRVMDKIEQSFGKKISPAVLFAGPTIEHIHALLQAEDNGSPRPLVGIQTNGQKRPFFYLPGTWNSGAAYCFSIAQHLGLDQPFYVLEPYYFKGPQALPDIESMATTYLESIRTVQPEGPYQLGGFCNGALLAYEMARQLLAQGEQVDHLIMIDPAYAPRSHELVQSLIKRVSALLRIDQTRQVEYFLRLRHIYKLIRHQRNVKALEEFTAIEPSIHTLLPTTEAIWKDNVALSNWIIAKYGYGSYPGKITLLQAATETLGFPWRHKLAEVHVIPGTHISCRTDHVMALAEEIKRCLA